MTPSNQRGMMGKFVEFLEQIVKDGDWEYGDGSPMTEDAKAVLKWLDVIEALPAKLHVVNQIRLREAELGLSVFQCGQLAGFQQMLCWATKGWVDPVRVVLTDAQIKAVEGEGG